MISKEELRRLALKRGITNIGFAEKDYLLDLLLYALSTIIKDELVFKGGTCLSKLYGMRRFSEDLDFNISHPDSPLDILHFTKRILNILTRFGITGKVAAERRVQNSNLLTFHLQGPLYTGKTTQIASVRLDINLKSIIILLPKMQYYTPIYSEIPMFPIIGMKIEEIAAEKVRAIRTRDKARDIFDLYFLLRSEILPNIDIINKKLADYSIIFNSEEFQEAIMRKASLWEKELRPLVLDQIPDFPTVVEYIKSKMGIKK